MLRNVSATTLYLHPGKQDHVGAEHAREAFVHWQVVSLHVWVAGLAGMRGSRWSMRRGRVGTETDGALHFVAEVGAIHGHETVQRGYKKWGVLVGETVLQGGIWWEIISPAVHMSWSCCSADNGLRIGRAIICQYIICLYITNCTIYNLLSRIIFWWNHRLVIYTSTHLLIWSSTHQWQKQCSAALGMSKGVCRVRCEIWCSISTRRYQKNTPTRFWCLLRELLIFFFNISVCLQLRAMWGHL